MMWQAMGYALIVAAALSAAGLAGERCVAWGSSPRRFIWIAVMMASIAFPLVAMLRAQPASQVPAIATVSVPAVPAAAATTFAGGSDAGVAASEVALPAAAHSPEPWRLRAPPDRLVLSIWAAASSLLALFFAGGTVLLRRRAAAWKPAWIQGQEVLVSDSTGPALLGAFRPRIVVPRWFLDESPVTQSLILAHEVQHRAARDPLLLWAAALGVVVLPWNLPLWWQLRRLRLAIELDCDARVLSQGAEPASYGEVLLSVTRRSAGVPPGVIAMSEPVSALQRRISHLMKVPERHALARTAVTVLIAAAGLGAAVALEAPAIRNPAAGTAAVPALPLLPARQAPDSGLIEARASKVMQRAVEVYPEIVNGPPVDGAYALWIVLRADGSVHDSSLRHAPDGRVNGVLEDFRRNTPREQENVMAHTWKKDQALPDGSRPRADVSMYTGTLPAGFDETRSEQRVQRAVRARHADLLLPFTAGEVNRLTVFLAEDGSIQREHVERVRIDEMRPMPLDDPASSGQFAERLAKNLAMDVSSLGVMGVTYVEEGSRRVIVSADGTARASDEGRKLLVVLYAWPRRASEAAPVLFPGRITSAPAVAPDTAAVLAVVERLLPDAFTNTDRASGVPILVLSRGGEVIRSGRIRMRIDGNIEKAVAELVPGFRLGNVSSRTIRNAAGVNAEVVLVWEAETRRASPGQYQPL